MLQQSRRQNPRLDALAADSLLFKHAYSNAPVCAVARSTILNDAYAVTQGTQHMRSRYPIPARFKPYVAYLRQAGYYCANRSKNDFNFKGNDRKVWDACSGDAHYKNCPPGQPFFCAFNLEVSHESNLFPKRVHANRRQGIIPKSPRLDPAKLELPPYLPDLPEVRSDFAIYHDTMTAMDRQVGRLLDELDERGLAEETIVFYFSDHGGPTPRGKRYLTDTGVRVPLLVHVPKKWRGLSTFEPGDKVDEPVAFVDLATTLLSLIGVEQPSQMQGRAFFGEHRVESKKDATVFLYADRFDEINGMRRGLTDGRFKYIRRFTPHLPAAPYSEYSLSMPSWIAWQEAWRSDRLADRFKTLWAPQQAVEELYDVSTDPWEINNLVDHPEHQQRLADLRSRLRDTMAETRDTGLVPESLFPALRGKKTVYDYVHSGQLDYDNLLDLAFLASDRREERLPALSVAMGNDNPCARYWAALGYAILGERAASEADKLCLLLDDPTPTVRMTAAVALDAIKQHEQANAAVLAEIDNKLNGPESLLLVNSLTQVDALQDVPRSWVRRVRMDPKSNAYTKRLADRLWKDSRQESKKLTP